LIATAILPFVNSAEINERDKIIFEEDFECISNRGIGIEIFRCNTNSPPPDLKITSVPDYFNWKDFGGQNWNSPVKNQGDCGCCWLHACLGQFESTINIIEGSAVIDPDLSEQYVLSCLPAAGSCRGGGSCYAMEYIMSETAQGNYHNGVVIEECFPYQADDDIPCDDKCLDWLDKLIPMLDGGYWYSESPLDDIIFFKSWIIEKGPAATDMFVNIDFQEWGMTHHDSDDYYPYVEKSGANHQVIIVGWKDDPFIDKGGYWICKNSWGSDWGYDGFFNIVYGSMNIVECLDWIEYDPESYDWPNEPNPPSETTITGKTNGKFKTEYEYTFNAVDPKNNDLKYYISWGDGTWEWTEYYPSGEDVTVNHTYNKEGNFSVAALAMNTNNSIGPWGMMDISMPKIKQHNNFNNLFERLFYRFPFMVKILNQIIL
jgi:C1A family cysteine protease